MIIATDLIPDGFDAITLWPFILIRPARRGDRGLVEHELVHYRQMAWVTLVWWLLYLLVPSFRERAEVAAYRRQIELGGISVPLAAHYLSDRYRLDLSYASALRLLS